MSLSAVIAEHSRRSDARHAVHCYTLVCPFLPLPGLVACCCKLACFGMLWTISEALPVLAGRASRPHAPARSRVCLRAPASRPPYARGVQAGWSRAGVGAASPRRAPPDTAKSDPRPYQSQCPCVLLSFQPQERLLSQRVIIHTPPLKREKIIAACNWRCMRLETTCV